MTSSGGVSSLAILLNNFLETRLKFSSTSPSCDSISTQFLTFSFLHYFLLKLTIVVSVLTVKPCFPLWVSFLLLEAKRSLVETVTHIVLVKSGARTSVQVTWQQICSSFHYTLTRMSVRAKKLNSTSEDDSAFFFLLSAVPFVFHSSLSACLYLLPPLSF